MPPLGLLELRLNLWHQKLKKSPWPGLSQGIVCMTLRLAILVQCRLVADGQMNRQTHDNSIYYASIASCDKNLRPLKVLEKFLNYKLQLLKIAFWHCYCFWRLTFCVKTLGTEWKISQWLNWLTSVCINTVLVGTSLLFWSLITQIRSLKVL